MATSNFQKETGEVVQQLNELFGNSLNLDIIKSVANACNFDVQQSSNQLLEITNESRFQSYASPTMNNFKINPVVLQNGIKKSRKAVDIENVIRTVNTGYKVLIILRGLPGSGKTTLAKSILKNTIGYDEVGAKQHILSTDDFFMRNGAYHYDPSQIAEAHGWNHQRAFNVMSKGYSPVIIDNTNSQMWEMKPYAIMATDYGYILEILEPDTHWCFNDKELAKRNKHDVPKSSIKNMFDRYERNVTPMKLLTAYDCKYKLQKPPQYRLYPPVNSNPTKPVQFSFDKPKPESLTNKTNLNKITPLKSFTAADSKISSIETINLMDFNEPDIAPSAVEHTKKQQNNIRSKSENNVAVDNMLMYEGSFLKSTILKPTPSSKIPQSTSLFDNIQNVWGVDEKTLRSWEIVTPLSETANNDIEVVEIDDEIIVELREISASTDDEDFHILRNINNYLHCEDVKVLNTCSRDINRNVPIRSQGVKKKLMLDKSCLTEDYIGDQNVHIEHLVHLFPNISIKTLKYWYNKCNHDFDCTIELLLNEHDEVISVVIDDDLPEIEVEPSNLQETIVIDSDSGSSSTSETPRINSKNSKQKRKNNSSSSDESQELKKCIESKVTISDDHYSQKLLKIKHLRFGKLETENAPQPSTSSALDPQSPKEYSSEIDFDECNPECDGIEWEESSVEQNQADDLETLELNLGDHFVKQLEDNFSDPNLIYPKGFQPVVQIPVTLARQLYTFYIESVYQQMDAQNSVMEALIKEDEEFARNLQEKEENAAKSAILESISQSEPTAIPEIMKEQKELSKLQKDADKWKVLTPDTLAAKLTKDKLFSVFPSLDKDTLVEILHAHDNVYQDTVETLLASTNINDVKGPIDTIKDPPINTSTIREMWEAHESCKVTEVENGPCSAAGYREEANRFLKKRKDLYDKAQKYYQSGMTEVAQFYSGLASQQTKFYENANSFAATAFLDEHSKRLQDFNTLDLHFLYVKEAIPSLDMFLDRNINLLRLSSLKHMEYLQIITGRGRNSQNGVAKIRPAVISRLKQRNIRYQQLNPGLLKIKISKQSILTSEL